MNILLTLCARAGSKGLKNKNISNFLSYPLVYYTLSAFDLFCKRNNKYNITVAVNTDSEELINQIKKTNINYVFVSRLAELATDTVGKLDVIKDTYHKAGKDFDLIFDFDITSPLRTVKDIESILNIIVNNPDADGVFSVTHSRRSPYFNQVKKIDNGFYSTVIKSNALSRQAADEIFDMNASIYVFRNYFLKNSATKSCADGKMLIHKMPDTAVLDIDEPQDKELMELIAKYFYEKYPEYNEILSNIDVILDKKTMTSYTQV